MHIFILNQNILKANGFQVDSESQSWGKDKADRLCLWDFIIFFDTQKALFLFYNYTAFLAWFFRCRRQSEMHFFGVETFIRFGKGVKWRDPYSDQQTAVVVPIGDLHSCLNTFPWFIRSLAFSFLFS